MKLKVGSELLEQVRAHAASGYPLEVCGFLLGSLDLDAREIHVRGSRLAVNGRVDAAHHRYLIDAEEYRVAERQAADDGIEIVGVYHSHPDASAEPSAFDLAHAWPNQVYLIVSVEHGAVGDLTGWVLTNDRRSFAQVEFSAYGATLPTSGVEGAACLKS